MKAMDIIDRLDGLEPNQYSPEQKLRWLSILDGKIYEEVLRPRETEPKGFTEYVNGNQDRISARIREASQAAYPTRWARSCTPTLWPERYATGTTYP